MNKRLLEEVSRQKELMNLNEQNIMGDIADKVVGSLSNSILKKRGNKFSITLWSFHTCSWVVSFHTVWETFLVSVLEFWKPNCWLSIPLNPDVSILNRKRTSSLYLIFVVLSSSNFSYISAHNLQTHFGIQTIYPFDTKNLALYMAEQSTSQKVPRELNPG